MNIAASTVGPVRNKKRLQYLRECAQGSGNSVDAADPAVVVLCAAARYDEALPIARGLIPHYPQGLAAALEEGQSFTRRRPHSEAERSIGNLASGREDAIPTRHYEICRSQPGDLLRGQNDLRGRAAAYE